MPPSQSLVPFYVLAGLIIVAVWFTYQVRRRPEYTTSTITSPTTNPLLFFIPSQLYNYGMAVKTESKTILERHNVKVSRTGAVLSVKDSMVMEENRADKGQR